MGMTLRARGPDRRGPALVRTGDRAGAREPAVLGATGRAANGAWTSRARPSPAGAGAIELAETERAHAHLGLGWALQEEVGAPRPSPNTGSPRARARLGGGPDRTSGGIHEEVGELAEAEAAYRDAIRLQPRCAPALAKLGTLLRDRLPDADLAALEERLASPETNPTGRARLLFATAVVLDARGDYAGAAARSRQANALNLEMARGQPRTAAEHERFVDHLLDAFDAEFFQRTAGAGLESRRPVFIFGLPRSGTTLVEQILASHSRIHGAGELRLARRSFEAIARCPDVPGRWNASRPRPVGGADTGRAAPRAAGGAGRTAPRRADRGQDARQLPVSRPARRVVPECRVHPLPPRPPRRGRVVLDDRLPARSPGPTTPATSAPGSSSIAA